MKVLYIGRFQPFHKGHLSVIEFLFEKYGKENIVFAIGSSNKSHEFKNPFTFEERAEMLKANVPEIRTIYAVDDVENDEKWAEDVIKTAEFDAVCSGSNWILDLFAKEKIEAIKPKFYKYRNRIVSASLIRENIAMGKEWKHLVPEATLKIIEKIKGTERIRKLAEAEHHDWFYKKEIGN